MKKHYDVVGIGNAIVDVITSVDDQFLVNMGMDKGAMTLIDEDRAKLLYKALKNPYTASGGSAANTMAGLASFGATVGFIGKLADDELGITFRKDIQSIGVSFSTPPLIDGPATALSMIAVTPDAERSMNTYLGASTCFEIGDIDANMIKNANILYLEGYLFDRVPAKLAFKHASAIAREAGTKIALTLSDAFCVDRHRKDFTAFINDHVDIVFANESEIISLQQADNIETAYNRLKTQNTLFVITCGEKGSLVLNDGEKIISSALKTAELVDTTGAGDQFAAGFLFGLSHDKPLNICARLGHIAAHEVVSHYGPRPSVPYKSLIPIDI